jgi:hypothetical protein
MESVAFANVTLKYRWIARNRAISCLECAQTYCHLQRWKHVCQWLATGQWFSPDPPVSSTNITDCHDMTEILLKVALNTIKQTWINDLILKYFINLSGNRSKKVLKSWSSRNWNLKNVEKHCNILLDLEIKLY